MIDTTIKAAINIDCSLLLYITMKNIRFILSGLVLMSLLFLTSCKGEHLCDVSDAEITECHSVSGYTWSYNSCECVED